jgi:hypothetical protein
MLRILYDAATARPGEPVRITLVGQVRGLWADELRRVCGGLLAAGHDVELDMAEVSFVDAAGLRVFEDLPHGRAWLVNCALFVAAQLETLGKGV